MGARFEIVHAAFSESSIGQFASVTCVDAPRLPISPAIYISSTSRNRRPMRHVKDIAPALDMMPGLKERERSVPGLFPSAYCPAFLQALYQFAPRW